MSIVTSKLRNAKRILNSFPEIINNTELIHRENDCSTLPAINVIEIHPTDICDLQCSYCSYKHQQYRESLNVDIVKNILRLKPKAVVIAGGGEPTLYKNGYVDLNDIIDFLSANNIAVGLITNGSRKLKTSTLDKLSWLRVSLDAITEADFFNLKHGKLSVRKAFLHAAIDSTCQHVGIGFLYGDHNINNLLSVCRDVFSDFNYHVNIQFRPICRIQSCDCPSQNYAYDKNFTSDREFFWQESIKQLTELLSATASEDEALYNFVVNNTNLLNVLANSGEKSLSFSHCYSTLARWLIRADGNIYPCVMKATNDGLPIGNLSSLSVGEINMNLKGYYNLAGNFCRGCETCCRLAGVVNETVEKATRREPVPNHDSNIVDYFY
ncbi:radical SAM protein [Superficieibacter sp. HKU1]|uniref:radical SAM protein n=1 Tax=Superficieibacter sp. HKU1 TaxID=3031919 RepID=UPI0023E324FE|nr:radical SAM protein [Superficieibacter sp. HKU1]WES69018.1 radical SAM protein [Superficieibacter sp. HKU1]